MLYDKNEIIEILRNRDKISLSHAIEIVEMTQYDIDHCLDEEGCIADLEQIILDNLGLEPDYLETFLLN